MPKRPAAPTDPAEEWREWQDHNLDPGYFTGGRIHPVLKRRRPNAYGWMLLVGGLIAVYGIGGAVRSGQYWLIFMTGVGAFVGIWVGLALLRKK